MKLETQELQIRWGRNEPLDIDKNTRISCVSLRHRHGIKRDAIFADALMEKPALEIGQRN